MKTKIRNDIVQQDFPSHAFHYRNVDDASSKKPFQ